MGLSRCPLVLKGFIHAFYSCKEPFFAQGRVCRSLRLLQRPVTQQPHDNIDPRRCHCVPCLGGLSPMKAAPTFSAGERRSPRWLRTPGVQKKRPQSSLEVKEQPRSQRSAPPLQLAALGGMSSQLLSRQPQAAPCRACCRGPRVLCSLAAAVVDNWHRDCAGAQDGRRGWAVSRGVDRPELAELCRPRARAAEGLGRCVLRVACASC